MPREGVPFGVHGVLLSMIHSLQHLEAPPDVGSRPAGARISPIMRAHHGVASKARNAAWYERRVLSSCLCEEMRLAREGGARGRATEHGGGQQDLEGALAEACRALAGSAAALELMLEKALPAAKWVDETTDRACAA